MIFIVKKEPNRLKTLLIVFILLGVLVGGFVFYYLQMSKKFQHNNEILSEQLKEHQDVEKKRLAQNAKVEDVIFKEAKSCVDLIGQEKIQSIKIVKDKLHIVCDWDTDIEPLFIRYGVLALVKSTPENIRISIDLKFIVESNYEA